MVKQLSQRISLSLPPDVVEGLQVWMEHRKVDNRSQAVTSILREELANHQGSGNQVMAGTITLFYDETQVGLQARVSELQRTHVKEVVTSLSVLLEKTMRMEVLVVQGPVRILENLVCRLLALKGVRAGKLTLTSAVLPPLHDRVDYAKELIK